MPRIKAKRGQKPRAKGRVSTRKARGIRKTAAIRGAKRAGDIHGIIAREVDSLMSRKAELESQLGEIENRLSGLQIARDALEHKGYSPPVSSTRSAVRTSRTSSARATKPVRRGGWSEKVLTAISDGKANTRSDLIKLFKAGRDTKAQMGISNAIALLKNSGRITSPSRGEYKTA
jgi:hypothetical protein